MSNKKNIFFDRGAVKNEETAKVKETGETVRINFIIDKGYVAELRKKAKEEGGNISTLIRRLLLEYLRKN